MQGGDGDGDDDDDMVIMIWCIFWW
jgi:hypothetical protein